MKIDTSTFVSEYSTVLNMPLYNKGTSFTQEERAALGLTGLLPYTVESLQDQALRAYRIYNRFNTPMEKYMYLTVLRNTNTHLFYKLLIDHVTEMMPIVYTPTVLFVKKLM